MRLDLWTLALQAVNALVLIWLLTRFLYRPITAIIAQRSAHTAKLLAEAAEIRAQATQQMAALEAARADLGAEGERIRADAQAQAAAASDALRNEAREAAATLHREAEEEIRREREAAQAELERAASGLAVFIARRLLERLPASAATEAFLASLATDLAALPGPVRQAFLDAHQTVTVVSATALDAAAQSACRTMLADAGAVVFETDPDLIAGIEMRTPQVALRASWQAELQHIADALGRKNGNAAAT